MLSWIKQNQNFIIASAIALICLILSMFFFDSSKFSMDALLLLDIGTLKAMLLSAEFWLGTLFFCLTTGLLLGISVRYEKKPALIGILLSLGVAYLISFLLFPIAKELLVVFVFYVLSLIWGEEIVKTRLAELKKLPILRSINTALEKLVLVVSIGFFFSGMFMVMPAQQKYLNAFEDKFLSSPLAGSATNLSDVAAELKVQSEDALLEEIKNSSEFKALRESQSEADQNFVAYILKKQLVVESQEYKNKVKEILQKSMQETNVADIAKKSIPLYGLFERYVYIMLPFSALCIAWLFLAIVVRTMGLAFGVIAAKTV